MTHDTNDVPTPHHPSVHLRTRELLDYLDRQRSVLGAAVDAVPPPLRDRVPAPGRWSAAGVIEHLAIVEESMASRLVARIAEARAEGLGPETIADPVLPTFNIDQVLDRTARFIARDAVQPTGLRSEAAWAALEHAGAAIRETLLANDGLALGAVSMPHPRFGSMLLYYFFAFIGAHEARHAAQIREIVETFTALDSHVDP